MIVNLAFGAPANGSDLGQELYLRRQDGINLTHRTPKNFKVEIKVPECWSKASAIWSPAPCFIIAWASLCCADHPNPRPHCVHNVVRAQQGSTTANPDFTSARLTTVSSTPSEWHATYPAQSWQSSASLEHGSFQQDSHFQPRAEPETKLLQVTSHFSAKIPHLSFISVAVIKTPWQEQLLGQSVKFTHSSRLHSVTAGKSQGSLVLRESGHSISKTGEKRATNARVVVLSRLSPVYEVRNPLPREWCHQQCAGLPTSISVSRIFPHRHAHRTTSSRQFLCDSISTGLDYVKSVLKLTITPKARQMV